MGDQYGISADPGIELEEVPLHLFILCPLNNLRVQTLGEYSRSSVLTDQLKIPGRELVNKAVRRATMDTKMVLRRSYRLLWTIHKSGFTLKGNFTVENFVVDSELSVKMCGIHLSRFTRGDGDEDYKQFVKVLEEGVFSKEPIPRDIRQWVKLIDRGIAEYEYLICYHISLMEPHQAVDCFISLYNIFQDLETDDPKLYGLLISSLERYDGWKSGDTECVNDLLSAARNFRNPQTRQRVFYSDDIKGILKLTRDCLEHPARRYRDRFALIMNDDNPDLLSDFQEAMYDVGLLQRLRHDTSML